MKHYLSIVALFALVALGPGRVFAQAQPTATPTPDPHVYNDPAIHLRVPTDFHLVAQHPPVLAELTSQPTIAAVWVRRKPFPEKITLAFASDSGRASGWATTFTNAMRAHRTGLLVKRERIALKNGMPAYFLKLTFGSGLQEAEEYAVVWSDGQRGAVFAFASPSGDVTPTQAKADLTDVSAVLYPLNQP